MSNCIVISKVKISKIKISIINLKIKRKKKEKGHWIRVRINKLEWTKPMLCQLTRRMKKMRMKMKIN